MTNITKKFPKVFGKLVFRCFIGFGRKKLCSDLCLCCDYIIDVIQNQTYKNSLYSTYIIYFLLTFF